MPGCPMNDRSSPDDAASEIVGTIVLVTIFVAAAAIILVLAVSQLPSQKLPALNPVVTNESRIVLLHHGGGDPLPIADFSLRIDGITVPFSGQGSDGIWSVGETLVAESPAQPREVTIVFTGSGSGQVVLFTRILT